MDGVPEDEQERFWRSEKCNTKQAKRNLQADRKGRKKMGIDGILSVRYPFLLLLFPPCGGPHPLLNMCRAGESVTMPLIERADFQRPRRPDLR